MIRSRPIQQESFTLTRLQRTALLLAGHHVPSADAAWMLGLGSAEDVLDALDQATAALREQSYYAAYLRAHELGLLRGLGAAPAPVRIRPECGPRAGAIGLVADPPPAVRTMPG